MFDAKTDEQDLYDEITKVNVFIRTWDVYCGAHILRCNYDISKILELIESHFHMVFSNKTINLEMNPNQYEVEINPNVSFGIA